MRGRTYLLGLLPLPIDIGGKLKNKKKVKLAQFNDNARRQALRNSPKRKVNDGLDSAKRREKRIKKAANGCWWIEQYIRGSQ